MVKRIVRKIFRLGGIEINRQNKDIDWFYELYLKYRDYTMVPFEDFKTNLELCKKYYNLNGDYVECGVWRGGMSAAASEILGHQRIIHLFDSFEGLPPAKEIDGKEALQWQNNKESPGYFDNCRSEESFVQKAMILAGHANYIIHRGWFHETLPHFGKNPIGILRLDGDWYDSILVCMEALFPLVIDGGIVIIDDYYTWDGCSKAVHDYLSKVKSASRIYQLNNQVAYIVKKID